VPPVEVSEANSSLGVVRKSHHHQGRGDRVEHSAQRDLRGDREAVALVAQPGASDGGVDREEQRVEPGGGRAADQVVGDLPVAHHVELEPVAAVRVGRPHVLDRRRAEGGQRERDARRAGRACPGGLALGVHEAGEAGRGDAERQRRLAAEDGRRGVDGRDVLEDGRVELDVLERLPGTLERDLGLGGAVGVVEGGLRRAALGDVAQVVDRQRGVEPPLLRVELRLLEPHELEDLVRLGELAIGHVSGTSGSERIGRPPAGQFRRLTVARRLAQPAACAEFVVPGTAVPSLFWARGRANRRMSRAFPGTGGATPGYRPARGGAPVPGRRHVRCSWWRSGWRSARCAALAWAWWRPLSLRRW